MALPPVHAQRGCSPPQFLLCRWLWPLYWVAQGTMFWALFVVGHDWCAWSLLELPVSTCSRIAHLAQAVLSTLL